MVCYANTEEPCEVTEARERSRAAYWELVAAKYWVTEGKGKEPLPQLCIDAALAERVSEFQFSLLKDVL